MKMRVMAVAITLALSGIFWDEVSAQGLGVGASIDVEHITPLIDKRGDRGWPVKFLCGTIPSGRTAEVVPGTYMTAINILNLSHKTVDIFQDFPNSIGVVIKSIGHFEELKWNCADRDFGGFAEGFTLFSVASGAVLDVVAVYTLKSVEQTPQAP